MKNTFLALAFLGLFTHSNAQNLDWVFQMGNTSEDRALATTVDAAGNIYITGQFDSKVDFDPGPDSLFFTAASSGEAFMLKLDAQGNLAMIKTYGYTTSGHTVVGSNISLDAAGNIFTAGYFGGSNVDFDPDPVAEFKLSYLSTGNTVFVQKLDAAGGFLWAKRWGYDFEAGASNMAETGPSMTLDNSGNVLTTGRFTGSVDFDPGTGIYKLPGGKYEGYISKLNTNGDFVWAKQFTTDTSFKSTVWPRSIAVDAANNMYVSGAFKGTVDFDPDSVAETSLSSAYLNGFVVKLDSSGNFVWVQRIGNDNSPTFEQHSANELTVDAAGNSYVTGGFRDTVQFGNTSLISNGNTDIYVAKLNPAGSFLWAKQIGSFYDTDEGRGVKLDANGDVFVTGHFEGIVDFNPGAGATMLSSLGARDVFVLKLTSTGEFVWAKSFGGPKATKTIEDIAIHGDNVYTVGRFNWHVNFDPNGSHWLVAEEHNSDIFIHKMIQGPIGIEEFANANTVIYPNPATNQFTVRMEDAGFRQASLRIFDIQGRKVLDTQLNSETTVVDINSLANGMYIVQVQAGESYSTQKLIVQK